MNNLEKLKREAFDLLLTNIYQQGYEDGRVYPKEGYGHPDWFQDTWAYAIQISKCVDKIGMKRTVDFLKNWRVVDCVKTLETGTLTCKCE